MQIFKTRSRADWCELLEGTDACFSPVLSFAEAPHHPHLQARKTFIEVDGVVQPAPAPRFSRSQAGQPTPPEAPSMDRVAHALAGWLTNPDIDNWRKAGVFASKPL
jgi:crotonobetainyl-CoA:carnitine CoA-transferase CaiB-like acyl-CoA transferase